MVLGRQSCLTHVSLQAEGPRFEPRKNLTLSGASCELACMDFENSHCEFLHHVTNTGL